MEILENVELAPLTTLKVGGFARYFAEVRTVAELSLAIGFAGSHSLPIFTLGGGSNLVIADAGWPGVVIKIGITGVKEGIDNDGRKLFDVGAGESWDKFVALAVAKNCSGVECLSGIPGNVGGTPIQNVGAYGQEVANTIESVHVLDLQNLDSSDNGERTFSNSECCFGYRTSIFNTTERGRYVVLRVTYALQPNGGPFIKYADLQRHFAFLSESPSLAETREAVLKIRASKAMLIVPDDPDSRSAGSFFKNPVLAADSYVELQKRAEKRQLTVPSYPTDGSERKVSAAWLVENSGFHKGYGRGPVGISNKHTLAIVNRGGATAADVVEFKNEIQAGVEKSWNIRLEPEPVFVGF
jgi:UDP-N-acetylmuramate dehydrogenase